MNRPKATAELDYVLPAASIAQSAVEPRDRSRLLVVDGLRDMRFTDLPDLLEPGDLLVVNQTRVRSARLTGHKVTTGGTVEVLLLRRSGDEWDTLIKPARRIHAGTAVEFGAISGVVLSEPERGMVRMRLEGAGGEDVDDLLPAVGDMPLPPYFHGTLDDPERYQTMFAKSIGSAAAPTAALHFTPDLVDRLIAYGIGFTQVELDVGLDTFRPIAADVLEDHVIHQERFVVPLAATEAIAATRRSGGRVVAVGTTVVRTLETAATNGVPVAGEGVSSLFIRPGFRFQVVDAMITNFHAPRTSLIALVAAAIGPDWSKVYDHALVSGYRFLSFGDAMLIERVRSV